MVTDTNINRPPQWLALHFPDLADQASLERLAAWCYQYSSQVCTVPQCNGLLLEIAASRRLFGNAETLAKRITSELAQLDYRVSSGIAPTPETAQLAARHGLFIRTTNELRKSIGALRIDCLYHLRPYRPYKRRDSVPLLRFSVYHARRWLDAWDQRSATTWTVCWATVLIPVKPSVHRTTSRPVWIYRIQNTRKA